MKLTFIPRVILVSLVNVLPMSLFVMYVLSAREQGNAKNPSGYDMLLFNRAHPLRVPG